MDTYKPRLKQLNKKKNPVANPPPTERLDGRSEGTIRPQHMKIGLISQASGSAYVETADCKVICGVYGPKQTTKNFSEQGKLWCDFRYAPFATETRRRQKGQDQDEREVSAVLTEAVMVSVQLNKFPKSVIEAHVTALEAANKSSMLAAAICCVSLALTNAGIDMYDLVAACTVGDYGGKVILDPSSSEQMDVHYAGGMMVARMAALEQVTHVSQWGNIKLPRMQQLSDLCIDGCALVYELMSQTLKEAAQAKQLEAPKS